MRFNRSSWLALTLVVGILFGPAGLGAQQAPDRPSGPQKSEPAISASPESQPPGPKYEDYAHSKAFPNILAPYSFRYVPELRMSNSERIHSLTREGKLYLSLEDAIALSLENNLDIALSRYSLAYAQTDILRTKAGGAFRGTNPGLFGGVTAFAGGAGAGGGGGGTGGAGGFSGGGGATNIGSLGCCDPFAGFNFSWDRSTTPLNNATLTGVSQLIQQTTRYSSFFGQGFLTGTSYLVALSGFRQSTSGRNNLFNPDVPTGMTFGINQRLLNGFGYRANSKFIRIAKNDLRFADSTFRQQVMTTVTQVSNLYWDLVSFLQNVNVAEKSLGLAQKTLSDNKRQVEIGTLAPIEVVRAESEVAARQQDLIVAQTSAQQQQELLKTALSKHVDPDLAGAEIVPTDKLPEPKQDDIPPLNEALQEAVKSRPEIEQADLNIRNQEITIQQARNSLLPTLDVFASYVPTGLSGNQQLFTCPAGSVLQGQQCVPSGGGLPFAATFVGIAPGGVFQSLSQTFHGNFPDYSFGVTLSIPLRNRQGQADAAVALLQERQLRMQVQQKRNQVEQDVRNANIAVTQARAQIEAARKAVTLAQQTLDAEQKKFQLGESTVFLVIQAQRDLATAEGNQVKAYSAYSKALTQFSQATGTTLAKNHIELADAKEGRVARTHNIPGTPGGY